MAIKIVTDSTADISPELAAEMDIEVVPIYVRFGTETYRDGVDLTPEEFYAKLGSSSIFPNTSQPSPDDFAGVYSKNLTRYDGVVSIHISSRISGTLHAAELAVKKINAIKPVQLIDSKLNSAGLALVVMAAARFARKGAGFDVVVAEALKAVQEVRMFGIFQTTKYLIHGGRASQTITSAVKILNIMPLLTFKDGKITPAGFVRTARSGMDRIYDYVKKKAPLSELCIAHSNVPDQAMQLKKRLLEFAPENRITISQLGAALGSHGGKGVLLVALRQDTGWNPV
jgi:DegV family protein with EDD domain